MKKRFDIGILGGGQLGRMLVEEGRGWDLRFKVLDSEEDAPAAQVAQDFLCASLDDASALRAMVEDCEVLTIETEQVDATALSVLEAEGHRILPSVEQIARLQDKGLQKKCFEELGLPTAPFVLLSKASQVAFYADLFPAAMKLRRAGYDGKGVRMFSTPQQACREGFTSPSYLEQKVNIQKELAVIVARSASGQMRHYTPVEMVFHNANLLNYLISPADVPPGVEARAVQLAEQLCEALHYVGVLAVEMFWTEEDELLINEVAPRVHNSGHHTLWANDSSQFGQLIRILKSWPLGSTRPRSSAALLNILGPEEGKGKLYCEGLGEVLAEAGCYVYLYGKKESRPNRKMGHVTIIAENKEVLLKKLHVAQQRLGAKLRS